MKKLLLLFYFVPLSAALFFAYYFYDRYQQSNNQMTNPAQAAEQDLNKTIKATSKHIVLPQNEVPTLATVSDKSQLQNEPFFQKSENGDKVLVYANARKAYLYRPSIDRLIDVASLSPSSDLITQNTAPSEAAQNEEISVVLRNGTQQTGVTYTLEQRIIQEMPSATVIRRDVAARNTYEATTVIIMNEKKQQAASQLAKLLNAKIGQIPPEEIDPTDADVLVIVGRDKLQQNVATQSAGLSN